METSQLKVLAYIMTSLAEDVETQKRGLVCVLYCVGGTVDIDFNLHPRGPLLVETFPIRIRGLHFCIDRISNPGLRAFKAILPLINRDHRSRVRFHDGA